MEYQISYFLNHLGQGTIVDKFSFYISWIPFLIVLWLIASLIALIFDRTNGKWVFLGTILTLIVFFVVNDIILKQSLVNVFFRERPYLAYPGNIFSIGKLEIDSSFPSGHISIIVALITFYIYFYRKLWLWIASLVFIVLLSFSRIHNGMHYPTDILGGIVFGVFYGYLVILLINVLRKKPN